MKLKLDNYIKNLENKIKNNPKKDDLDEALTVIKFFQHERLVHLIVTIFVGIVMTLLLLGLLITKELILVLIFIIVAILFIFYIFHYYYLENGTQKLYDLYLEMKKRS